MSEFKGVYLDHNATSPVKPEVLEAMIHAFSLPGNASSVHKFGRESRKMIESARAQVEALVNAGGKAVTVFTSGATEANNLVIRGSGCQRILVSAIEHPSVLNAVHGREIIPVLSSGIVDIAALDKMLEGNDRATLISVMYVNNETGIVQPIDEIVAIARKRGALVHTDAVQAAGKIPVDIQKLGVDYLTLSAHKMGGPQGAGCLIMANCVTVTPMVAGGNQEKSMRAGTENLAGIVGFGKACAIADAAKFQQLGALRDKIESKLKSIAPSLKIFGEDMPRISNTTMFALPGASSETQLISLDLAGICVSNGSACSSGTVKASHVLKAMNVPDAEAQSALRVSLGWNTTEKDVDYFTAKWAEMYERVKNRLSAA